jgi:hypothetical protein
MVGWAATIHRDGSPNENSDLLSGTVTVHEPRPLMNGAFRVKGSFASWIPERLPFTDRVYTYRSITSP